MSLFKRKASTSAKKAQILLSIHQNDRSYFDKTHGTTPVSSLRAMLGRIAYHAERAKAIEIQAIANDKRLERDISPRLQSVNDTYDIIKFKMKRSDPEKFKKYFE